MSNSTTTSSAAAPSCTTAVPNPANGNVPIDACNAYYNFDPSFPAAVFAAVVFGLLTVGHIVRAAVHKKLYAWTIITGGLWEFLSSVLLAQGSRAQQNVGYATAHALLFLLAPLWINAFAYTTAARLAHFLLPDRRLVVPARRLATIFVLLDVAAFVVQGVGGVMAGPGADPAVARAGLRVYTGGVAGQLGCICVFGGLLVLLWVRLVRVERESGVTVALGHVGAESESGAPRLDAPPYATVAMVPVSALPTPNLRRTVWRPVVAALGVTLFLIAFRIAFRIAEFARGVDPETNPLPFHEVYSYVFDAVPMMAALGVLLVVHPGRLLQGPGSEFPGRRERREEKRAKKEEKKARKEEKRLEREQRRNARVGAVEMV